MRECHTPLQHAHSTAHNPTHTGEENRGFPAL